MRLHRVDQYTASLLEKRLSQEGVVFRLEPFTTGWVSYLYDNDVLPTDKLVLARWSDYERAKELSAEVGRQVEKERASVGEEEETFQDMPPKKRIAVQIVSVFLFIVLIMLVDASSMLSIPSPTFLYTIAASARAAESAISYPSRAKSAVAETTSDRAAPRFLARATALVKKLS